jgi:proline racemase
MRMIQSIEAHCGGPHCRIVLGGLGDLNIPGETMFEKRKFVMSNRDWLRTLLAGEPRAGATTNIDLILPSPDPRADIGVVIIERVPYYPPMSGGNIMAVATVLLETGVLAIRYPTTELVIDTPAGLIDVRAECADGRVRSVTLLNVPSFATHLHEPIDVPTLGALSVDVAYGGMFYVLADAKDVGLEIDRQQAVELVRVGELVKQAARAQLGVCHPTNPEIDLIESLVWRGPARSPGNHGRNTVVMSLDDGGGGTPSGLLDRSPCGTGTSAHMAVLHAKGELALGQDYRHEGILDSVFSGRIVEQLEIDGVSAIRPAITGRAWVCGYSQHIVHDDDPFPHGFLITDHS